MRPHLLAPLLLVGCYLAHERPTSTDAGPRDVRVADAVTLPPVEPAERRVPGVEPYLAWDGDEVALVTLPNVHEPRVLHRFTASLEPTAAVPLDDGILGGVAWRADRLGVCAVRLRDGGPLFRELSLDGSTVLSERPMGCVAVTPWGDSWGTLILADDGGGVSAVTRVGGASHAVDALLDRGAMAVLGDDLVVAYVTPELDVVLLRIAPEGTLRTRHQLHAYGGWFVALAAAPDGTLALAVDTSPSRDTIELVFLGEDLVPRGEPVVLVTAHDGIIPPRLAAFDGGWVLAWLEMNWSAPTLGPIDLLWLDRAGAPLGEPRTLADAARVQSLALTVAEGAAYVAHDATVDIEHPELLLRRLPLPR